VPGARGIPAESGNDGWNGLKRFIRMTGRNSVGQVVKSPWLTFCSNTYDPEGASPDSPAMMPCPQSCGFDPFPLSMVWDIAKGWATDPPRTIRSRRWAPPVHAAPGHLASARPAARLTCVWARPPATRMIGTTPGK